MVRAGHFLQLLYMPVRSALLLPFTLKTEARFMNNKLSCHFVKAISFSKYVLNILRLSDLLHYQKEELYAARIETYYISLSI